MRSLADRARITRLMEALGRATTIDVDLVIRPDDDALFRALSGLKESLSVNIETASPLDFIPVPEGWEDRSVSIARIGSVEFLHFDLYAQAALSLSGDPRTGLSARCRRVLRTRVRRRRRPLVTA